MIDLLQPKKQFIPKPAESPEVIEARWHKKKAHAQELANGIRRLRVNISRDLKSDDEKTYLTALAIALIDKTAERVGSNKESEENGRFGVTGFQKRHISVTGNKVNLDYVGKTKVPHKVEFSDERIAKALKKAIKNSPSEFALTTTKGLRIKSGQVNSYLQEYHITAKSLRGYACNRWTIEKLSKIEPEETDKKRKKQLNHILKQVSERVGHSRATLKKHYLIPELWDEWLNHGKIINLADMGYLRKGGEVEEQEEVEEELVEDEPVEVNASFGKVDCDYQIFEITSNKKSDVARIVVRFQEHYDEKEFKGKIFTLDEFKKYYSKGKEFTYYYDWNGFNFPDYAVEKFLEGKFDPLSPEEKWLVDNIKANIDTSKPYCIVGYASDDEDTINHERAHALYYLSPEYKKDVDAIIDSIPKSELGTLTKFMDVRNYHPSVYKDEMQAYLMADKEYLQKYNGWQDSYELDHQELRLIFDRYFNIGSKLAIGGKIAAKKSFKDYYAEDGWLIF